MLNYQKAIRSELRLNKYIPHKPTRKQRLFLLCKHRDILYGGAAGGGKSDALLMAALQYVDIPGYAALLVRDTLKNLTMPKALIDRANEWLNGTGAQWQENKKTWTFPSGSTLTFGHLDGPRDHYNYDSAEFQYVGIDEARSVRWSQALYLFSRLRRLTDSSIPVRFRLASNPGGRSHGELKQRYVNSETRGDRIFIPAGLDDNPHLDRDEYIKSLQELDPVTREQLLRGDWDIREKGRMFDRSWFKIVDKAPEGKSVRYWDKASTEPSSKNKDPDWTVGFKMIKSSDKYYIDHIIRFRKSPKVVEQIIQQVAKTDGIETHIIMEQEPGSSGKDTIDHYRGLLAGYVFKADKTTGSKTSRAMPLASMAESGGIILVNGAWIADFLDEFEIFPDGNHDDQVDAGSGAFQELAKSNEIRIRMI